jgi:hypothetical protein
MFYWFPFAEWAEKSQEKDKHIHTVKSGKKPRL